MQDPRPLDAGYQTPQYPRLMADETPGSEEPLPRAGAPSEPAAPVERYGTVWVSRNRKQDGRALLLYTREDPDQA